jgi:hypothetical protein
MTTLRSFAQEQYAAPSHLRSRHSQDAEDALGGEGVGGPVGDEGPKHLLPQLTVTHKQATSAKQPSTSRGRRDACSTEAVRGPLGLLPGKHMPEASDT